MKKVYSCVDIGSDSIKIVVSELLDDKLNILSSVIYPTSSVKKGIIISDNEFYEDLKNAFKEINNSLGVKIDKAIVNVPIYDAEYKFVDGETVVKGKDHLVTGDDMVRVLENSIKGNIEKDKELVTIMPIKYIVDGNETVVVPEPRGLRCEKLKVYAMLVKVPTKNIIKIVTFLEKLNIDVIDILFGAIGDYYELKEDFFDKEVVGVINIGSDKTELSIFNNGIITNSTILQLGSKDIDDDLSYVFNIKSKQGKMIKEMFALGHKDYASTSEVYELKNKSLIKTKINQFEASEIVMTRLKEILEKSKKELNNLTKKEIRYIIVTGGITNIPGFDILAKEVLNEKLCLKQIKTLGIRDNSYSSSIGMIRYFINKLKIRGKEYSMFNEENEIELIENKGNLSSESLFEKMFDYLSRNKED